MNLDWQLYERARSGDEEAWQELVRRHHAPLARLAFMITGSTATAQDLAQESLVQLLRRGVKHRNGRLGAYLATVAYHLALKEKRRTRHQRDIVAVDPVDSAPSALENIIADEKDRHVLQAIQSLADHHRIVLTLRFYGGHSYEEIARLTGLPLGTVKSRMFHAIQACRAELSERGVLT